MNPEISPIIPPQMFWKQLSGTIAIHEEINKTREHILIAKKQEQIIPSIKDHIKDLEYQTALELIVNSTDNFHPLFKKIFLDMAEYKFKDSASVNAAYDKHLIEYNNRYKLLSKINLFSHTINVVIETIKLTKDLPNNLRDIAILLALLHDVGKNSTIAKEFCYEERNKEAHHKISANYAKHILYDEKLNQDSTVSKDLIDNIYSTLRSHHETDRENSIFLDILIQADMNARELELFGILKNEKEKK